MHTRCGGIFDYDNQAERLVEVERELAQPEVWQDAVKAQTLGQERAKIARIVHTCDQLKSGIQENQALFDMACAENSDSMLDDIAIELDRLQAQLKGLEFQRMFHDDMDSHHAYLDIQSGSGGTEAQDWANMLLRMYLRWGERRGFKTTLTELSDGEVAGIKSATVHFSGDYAYGWLKTETGIHRLVRKSPFNANNKRHTSFASVFIYPEVDDSVDIQINPADLRIDTYRASGAGGQHVNRTDSAVRITHQPSNTVVQCQSERSQHQNKANAMSQLRAKLYELEMLQRRQTQQAIEETKSDIGWGHQIRSYVLDESRIKDLRTGVQSGNTKDILDGNIDVFLEASLLQGLEQ